MNEEIQKRLANIFKDTFNIIVENISNYGDKELLDRDYNLAARDLVILLFDIEKEFGITISEEDIVTGKFNTFNNILEIIHNQLQKKEKEAV